MRDYGSFELTPDFLEQQIPDLTPVPVVIDEMTIADTKYSLVGLEAHEKQAHHAQVVTVDDWEHLSEAARQHNQALVRGKSMGFVNTEALKVAVVSYRPTPEQLHYRANQSEVDMAVKIAAKLSTGLPNLFAMMTTAFAGSERAAKTHTLRQHPHHFEQTHRVLSHR